MKKKIKALLLLGLVFLGGCGQASAPSVSSAGTDSQSIDLFAMDTAMTLTAYGDHAGEALDAAKSEIERLDALFSISSERRAARGHPRIAFRCARGLRLD